MLYCPNNNSLMRIFEIIVDIITKRITHSNKILSATKQFFGPNNEPIKIDKIGSAKINIILSILKILKFI